MTPALIVFSHGNSFPAGTYSQLFAVWRAAGHEVTAVDRYGHDPRFPATSNWPHLRDELIEHAQAHPKRPRVLVGHSLGGLLSLMAACRKPALADALVMLDSPVVVGWRAHSLHMAKLSGLIGRVSPARVAVRRRYQWPSQEAVRAHFEGKHAFARWDPAVLRDYLTHGFEECQGQWQLRFDREIEARIYNGLPHTLGRLLRRHPLRCPVGFIAGRQSQEMRQGGSEMARRLAGEHFQWVEGTHLFPMEQPIETAGRVLALIEALLARRPPII